MADDDWMEQLPGIKDVLDGDGTTLPRRSKIRIVGADVVPIGDELRVTVPQPTDSLPQLPRYAHFATTSALPSHTVSGPDLTATANGALSVDGTAVSINQRILDMSQATAHAEHGLYRVLAPGSAGTPWRLTRDLDCDSSDDITFGLLIQITRGVAKKDKLFYLATEGPYVLGTTALEFREQTATAGGGGGGTGGIEAVRLVFTDAVADLNAVPVAQYGLTLAVDDRALLPRQTNPAEWGIYEVASIASGLAVLTATGETIPLGQPIPVLEGINNNRLQWERTVAGSYQPVVGTSLDRTIGQYGSRTGHGTDRAPIGLFNEVDREYWGKNTIPASTTVTVFEFDCLAQNRLGPGGIGLAMNVLMRWASDTKLLWASYPCTVQLGNPALLVQKGPASVQDGAGGSNNYTAFDLEIVGAIIRLKVTNSRVGIAAVAQVLTEWWDADLS